MAFPSFPAVTAVGSRLAGAYRVIRVDQTNGQTAIGSGSGSQTGDGWDIPINTIQGAINYIAANRANGQNGTADEWWGIEVSPGTYEENVTIYAWMHVYCMTPRAARIVGTAEGAGPIVTLAGGSDTESPCTISGFVISRDNTNRASAYAVAATRYAGASSGTLDVANTALVHNCFIKCTRHVEDNETWIDECMLKGLHADGGFMRLDNCDLELPPGFDLEYPDTVITEMLADDGGLFAFTYTQNSGSTVETAPIKLNNAAVRREKQTNQAINSPVALYLYQSFGTTGARIEASLNNTWRNDRFDDPGDVELEFGLTAIVNGGTLASINGSYTPAGGRSTTDVVSFNFISTGGGAALQPVSTPLEEAIVGDNCVIRLTGTWDSTNNLPEMVGATKGNLPFNENTTTNLTATAGGYSAALDFERDELSKSTVGMPRGSSVVTVGIDTGAPTNNVHALYFDGVDYQCDGTDDRNQIQSAIDAVAEFGGVVQLGPGVYNVSDGSDPILEIPANVTLRGMGAGVTTIVLQGTNGVGVELTGNRATLEKLTVQTNFDSEIAVAALMSGGLTLMRECEVDATASEYSGVAVALKITGSDNRALDSTMRGRVDDVSLELSGEGAYNFVSGCRRLNGDVQIESDDNRLLGCEIRVGNLAINGDRNDVSECTLGNGNVDVDGGANRVCNNRLLSGGVNVQVGANDANITHNTTTVALSDSGTLTFFGDQTSDSNQVT